MWQGESFIFPKHLCTQIYRSLRALMPLLFIYFEIILLSALHGCKLLPRWKSPQRTTTAFPQEALMLSDLTFNNNCSFLHKIKNIKSSLHALGWRTFYPVPRAGCYQPWALWCSSVSSLALSQIFVHHSTLGNKWNHHGLVSLDVLLLLLLLILLGGFFFLWEFHAYIPQ